MIVIRKATEIKKGDVIIVRVYNSDTRTSDESQHEVKRVEADWKGRLKFIFRDFWGPDVPQDADIEVVI